MPNLKPCRKCANKRKCFDAHHHLIESMVRDRIRRLVYDGTGDCFKSSCGECKHYMGYGDWDLCCRLQKRRLCYENTESCEALEEREADES